VTDLKPLLPADLPQNLTINTSDPRYVEAVKFATANKFTQQQFSALLAVEAHGALAKQAAATPAAAPAPAAPAKIEGYDKMTFAQKWQAGEARKRETGR
jgi:type IV secretory pathway VirB9-like protein